MAKSLIEQMEEAIRRPVPYEGLTLIDRRKSEHRVEASKSPAMEDNTRYREDFNSLVSAAARKKKPAD